jgi:hypothetical protein
LLYLSELRETTVSFFTEASLPHWSSDYLTNLHTGFLACRRCGFILLELLVCH